MTMKQFTTKNIICSNYCVWDNNDKAYGNDEVVELLNKLHEENKNLTDFAQHNYSETKKFINNLQKENERLKSDLARVIEQSKENDKFLRSDIRILKNALWCPNCANDIKRLKELRKEFLE